MCGIVAVVDLKGRGVREDYVQRLRDAMVHRGPDDAGVYVDGPVGLGHRRLTIIDLTSGGHQPMSNDDRNVHLVFNGEIYNYVELKKTLREQGRTFHSTSDTEVLLQQYLETGERCVDPLRGMFAFAFWDARHKRLFAARDRFGIKPLFYYQDADVFILASEIKAIIESESVPRRPNMLALADYLYAGRALGRKTLFEGIHELEPGHSLTLDVHSGRLVVKQYWDLEHNYNRTRTDDQTDEELYAILDEAVAIQCRSDAPLGAHLSDGLDSSAVVAFAARHKHPLKTFAVKFSNDPHVDAARYTRTVADHVGAEYNETSPTANDLAVLLPFLIWHMDSPLISDGGFGYLTVSEFARQQVKVCLTGHGGDEVFAGYPAQFKAAYNSTAMFQLFKDPERQSRNAGLVDRLMRTDPRKAFSSLLRRPPSTAPALPDLWAALHTSGDVANNPFVKRSWVRSLAGYSARDEYVAPFGRVSHAETLDQCLYHDLRLYLPALLQKEDRVSMAVSIESRVPLLDDRLVEFLATVPPDQKVRGLRPKHLLRQAVSRLLPDAVVNNRDKRGFPVPGSFWKSPRVDEAVRGILLSKASLNRGIFTERGLRRACDSVTSMWPLLNVELWFKLFIDRDPYWLAQVQEARRTRA